MIMLPARTLEVQTQIAEKEAEIKVTEARGIAESNRIIAGSLTREYLQHEANQALLKFAESGNTSTVIMPSGGGHSPHQYGRARNDEVTRWRRLYM